MVGCLALSDPVKPEAAAVVAALRFDWHVEVWMVTGDNALAAMAVAKAVGIPNVQVREYTLRKRNRTNSAQTRENTFYLT